MKGIVKMAAVLAVMIVAFGAVSVSSDTAYAAEGDKWSDSADTDWYDAASPQTSYTISSAEQLTGLAKLVNEGVTSTDETSTPVTFENVKITLAADIDLSGKEWTPIGNVNFNPNTGDYVTGETKYPFKGTFDGNGKTIRNMTVSTATTGTGLFGYIEGGSVSDLTLTNVKISSNDDGVGAVAGYIAGGAEISGVGVGTSAKNAGTVNGSGDGVGGIVGSIISEGSVEDCVNYANVSTSKYNAGGIAGTAFCKPTGEGMSISGCHNYGAVTSSGVSAGGIVGLSLASHNYGAVTSSGASAGGIVGLSLATISDCHNHSDVTGTGTSVGGIVGEQRSGMKGTSITGCTNGGKVNNNGTGTPYGTGGIAGWIRYIDSGSGFANTDRHVVTVSGCINSAEVSGTNSVGVGGIVGMLYHGGIVKGNTSSGNVTGANMVGGIIGGVQADPASPHVAERCRVVATGNTVGNITLTTAGANVGVVIGHLVADDGCTDRPNDSRATVMDNVVESYNNESDIPLVGGSWDNVVYALVDGEKYGYSSLEEAVKANNNGMLFLMDDIETGALTIDKGITLDLGGHILTITETPSETDNRWGLTFASGYSMITNGTIVDDRAKGVSTKVAVYVHGTDNTVQLTTSDLTITTYPSTAGGYSYALRVEGDATAYLNSGTTIEETANDGATGTVVGVAVFGAQAKTDSYTYMTGLTVNNGVSINTSGYAISGNGDGNNGTVITINGGTIESSDVQAIYHPQDGILNINGGSITGDTGIEMRAGTLNMTGGEVTGTGNPLVSGTNPGGSTTSGAGIAIVQHTTAYNIDVTVRDGTVSGYNAVFEKNTESSSEEELKKVSISLKGGEFKAINGGTQSVSIEDAGKVEAAVTGGTYEGDVSKYVPADQGIEIGDDGTVTPPFSFDYLSMIVVTTQFTVPVTSASGTQVSLACEDAGISYDASTGVFTVNEGVTEKTFTITGTVGEYTDTMTVIFLSEFITSADTDTGLMAVYVSNPDESVLTKLEEYPQITDWIFMDISRLDGSTQALTFNFGFTSADGEQLFVVHFNDDGTVDYPKVEIVDGVCTITPSGFSLFAFGSYTGEEIVPPEPEPEPTPEPEPVTTRTSRP